MTLRLNRIRRFHFNLPQRIAAGLLALFLIHGLWLTEHQTLTDRDYQYARCGREMWERPSALTGYYTTCGNIHDGVLDTGWRACRYPQPFAERGLDLVRKPEDRYVQAPGELSTWELRHQLTHILLLERLPFLLAGALLAPACGGLRGGSTAPGRLYGAGALLLFTRCTEGLCRAEC